MTLDFEKPSSSVKREGGWPFGLSNDFCEEIAKYWWYEARTVKPHGEEDSNALK